ncbi:MAG: hypothetical protein AAF401_07615 [Pseudomonadota bacterium]
MMVRLILAAALMIASAGAALSAGIEGAYKGIAAAQGMRLILALEDDVYKGVFTDRSGGGQPFDADILETGAETIMDYSGRKIFMRFEADGVGLRMVTIPFNEDEEMQLGNAQALIFIREDVEIPPRPRRYIDAPNAPGGTIDPEAFIESYAFWPSDGVAYGYGMVRTRYRTLIRLHALVQADILWKMCQSNAAPAGLAEALRGQAVSCQDVLASMGEKMRRGEPFSRFKADVLQQKAELTEAIRCSLDYRRVEPECKASGARVAQAAISLETVKSALARY